MARRHSEKWRAIVPRAVTVLGELGEWVMHDPNDQSFYGVEYKPGRILCSSPDGRHMYIFRPILDAGPVRDDAFALNAYDLHERFTHKRATDYYNVFVPPFRDLRFAGEVVLLRYYADKGDGGEVCYEHYFEQPGEAPAYAPIYASTKGQFYLPPDRWQVTEAGIEFARK